MTGKPANRAAPAYRDNLAAVRETAMGLVTGLSRLAKGAPKDCDSLLLRKGDGVIDGLNKLSQILVRIGDEERRTLEETGGEPAISPFDEKELERRITEELDRIASVHGAG